MMFVKIPRIILKVAYQILNLFFLDVVFSQFANNPPETIDIFNFVFINSDFLIGKTGGGGGAALFSGLFCNFLLFTWND